MALNRRQMTCGVLGVALAGVSAARAQTARWFDTAENPLGMRLTEEQVARGAALLRRHPSVDIHSHPGRFFLRGAPAETPQVRSFGAPFEDKVVDQMHAGHISAALFTGVADMELLDFSPERGLFAAREFRAEEAWTDYQRQIRVLQGLVRRKAVLAGRAPADVLRAFRSDRTAAVFAIEGGDFIESRLDRVQRARNDGVRSITIVHYHVNQIGDIQTEAPVHNGLTPLGERVIEEMNRAGIIVDLAHAPFSVVKRAVEVSRRPMMISHTNVSSPTVQHPRLVTPEHARLVTAAGGVVGSIPWGIGQANFGEWIDSILRMIDVVGVDHTSIGTDMDATYKPVFTDYRLWHLIPAALLAKGLSEQEIAKVIGGNFLRVFAANA